ncbi:MAG: DUF1349 domain-containing protein [Mycobacterium sp.]
MRGVSLTSDWTWTRATASSVDAAAKTVSWNCEPGSDYWRTTASGVVSHNGHALLHPADGDFALSAEFAAPLSERYDQCGLILIENETKWFKTSFERDGDIFVGGVATSGTSDWSRSPTDRLTSLKVVRQGTTVEVYVHEAEAIWSLIRQLTMAGHLQVGLYSAAPTGAGFVTCASDVELSLG